MSDIPFNGPIGAVVVGYIDGQFVFNPTLEQLELSELHLVVAGSKDAILMVEAGANELSEDVIIDAILQSHAYIKQSIELQESLCAEASKEKMAVPAPHESYAAYKEKINAHYKFWLPEEDSGIYIFKVVKKYWSTV